MNNIRVRLPRKLAKSVSGGVLAEEGRLNPVGAMGITLNMLPVHRVNMTLSENDLPLAMHDLVEVYNHKGSVGIYRVTKIPHTIGKNRKYELSHGLDVLSDATFDMIEEYKGTVAGMLAKIINAQTQKIGGVKYWQLGTCEDNNPWNKNIKYDNLMECLTEIARKEEDYMFTFDQSTFPWTLNFVARDSTVLSEFRLNRNTENCVITEDDADLCTRLYLSVTSETNDDEGHGTYIDEGYFTYNDTTAQSDFGIICKTAGVNQEDFASQAALEAWVAAYFGRHNKPGVQITIDGVELNKITGESIDEVHLSRICRVALPEYSCTFNERIVSVNYPDALRKPTYVRNSLANKRQTAEDAFSEIKDTATSASRSAGGAGRAAHNDATYFRRTIGDTANGLYSRIEQTAYYIRSEVLDTANGLYSRIEQTASYIRSEVANTANGLRSEIEQTASHIRAEVSDAANGLYSRIEETASYIRAEVADTANGLTSKIEQTASYIRSEVSNTANGLNSKIEQTASSIRSEVSDTANGLSSRISQNASAISLRVTKGDVATQLAVECGNVSISGGNLVVDGYVTAAGLSAAIGSLDTLVAQSIIISGGGSLSTTGYVACSELKTSTITLGGHSFTNCLVSASVSNNTLTLTDSAGGTTTFSKATTLIGGWSGGRCTVTASPQDVTYYTDLSQGEVSWDGNTATVPINAHDNSQSQYVRPTGAEVTVDASVRYTAGVTKGHNDYTASDAAVGNQVQGQTWYVNVTRNDGSSQLLEVNMASVYSKAREGYTLGTFTLASVTLEGEGVSIQAIGTAVYFKSVSITPVGTKYSAVTNTVTVQGTGVSIQAIGTAVYFKSVSITPIGTSYTVTARTRYLRKTTGITALTGYTNYNSGSSATLYKRSTNAYGDVTYSSVGYYVWRYGGSTQTLYEANGSVTDYDVGSGASGKTLYEAGTAVTRYEKLSSGGSGISTYYNAKNAQDYYQAGSSRTFYTYNNNGNGDLYAAGSAVTRYEKLSSNSGATNIYYNAKTAADYYKKGSTVTDRYYTKS